MLTRRSLLGSDNIPEDLRDPFYIDQYEQEHIKPPVIKLLLSSELYCRVCSLILKGDQVAALQGHQSVIQALSRKDRKSTRLNSSHSAKSRMPSSA